MVGFIIFCIIVFLLSSGYLFSQQKHSVKRHYYHKAVKTLSPSNTKHGYRFKAKPDWVKKEVILLKTLMRHEGCRKIAAEFNRQFKPSKNITVGKTYVAKIIREHHYQIQVLQKKLKHKPPKRIPRQLIWGIDLTFKSDSKKQTHDILGVVEHHSRKNLTLEAIKDKSTITLLSYIFTTIQKYGKPKIIRTDNEAIFTSRLFSLSLWLLGIKHQTTDIHSPWQNGRVERFFGTLKQKLNQCSVGSIEQFNQELQLFRFWYNNVRIHNNLDGKTPEEVWQNINVYKRKSKNIYYFSEWDGLLTGFYHPP